MNHIFVKDLEKYKEKEVEIKGFVDKVRDLQYVQFLIVRDSTGKVQITIEKTVENQNLVDLVSSLTIESTVTIKGILKESPSVKLRGLEIIPTKIHVTSISDKELPFDYKSKDNSLRETRLDYRFIDLRREENHLFFKCATIFEHALREYFINHDFMEIHSPKISAKAAESGAEVFKLDYFGREACLSQSPQFYKQMAMASGFDQVFEIGPAFRAENSHTSYHATEINMADVEVSWIDGFEDVMDMEEAVLKYAIDRVKDTYGEKIEKTFGVKLTDTSVKAPRFTFKEAKEILKQQFHYTSEREDDFERKEEMLLCKYVKEKYNSDFVFVTKFPFSARPFYHMLDEEGLTESYDLLFKGVEITTGSQREHRPDILKKQMEEKNINPEDLSFYLEFFKYGCPPHGGFGLGIARVLMQIFEFDNIRESTFIYRGPNRLNP